MTTVRIAKHTPRRGFEPNLLDYATTAAEFSWATARAELDGLPGGGLNIAHEAVDRHARSARASAVALRCLGRASAGGAQRDVTYAELAALSDRFANALKNLGVTKGDAVFALMPRVPELFVAALGTWKSLAVFCPLFPAFGPEPIKTRMTLGKARVLVTTSALYARKVAPLRAEIGRAHV